MKLTHVRIRVKDLGAPIDLDEAFRGQRDACVEDPNGFDVQIRER